jgi:uncharacterized membrane protein
MDQLESLELKISKFLRIGVLVAGVFMLIGWVSQVALHGDSLEAFKVYRSYPLAESLTHLDWPMVICYLGLGVLILLPITRVFLTAFLFVKQKEYLLAGIATFVLVALILSFSLGIEL